MSFIQSGCEIRNYKVSSGNKMDRMILQGDIANFQF